jgi:hypothetical protein
MSEHDPALAQCLYARDWQVMQDDQHSVAKWQALYSHQTQRLI